MAIVYNWIISSMETAPSEDGLTDVVKFVHWRRQATEVDGEKSYFADIYGDMICSSPDPMSFKAYNELTFDDVCGWLESKLNVDDLNLTLDLQIENQKNPPIVQLPLPWIPQSTQHSESEQASPQTEINQEG